LTVSNLESSQPERLRWLGFIAALSVLIILYAWQLGRLISFSLTQGYDSYVIAAPAITAYLIWNSRQKIFRVVDSNIVLAGLLAVVALAGVFLAQRYFSLLGAGDYLSVVAFSFCLFVYSFFLACFGQRAFIAAAFPFAMLLFFVPLPSQVTERVVAGLQAGSATLVYWLFSVLQVPVLRNGLVFTVPGVSIEIAAECSGINSSVALLITTLLVADETLRTASGKVIFVLLGLPLSILKNAIRIVMLTLLATHVNMGFLTGKLHHRGGFVFFALTLALMLPIWKLILKWEDARLSRRQSISPSFPASSLPHTR